MYIEKAYTSHYSMANMLVALPVDACVNSKNNIELVTHSILKF